MKVGFTGTQRGMTPIQRVEFTSALLVLGEDDTPNILHQGDCIGADANAALIGRELGFSIVSHPPILAVKRAFFEADVTMPQRDYISRNHDIVNAVEYMLATPGEMIEQLRSGTWATIRYAKKAKHLKGWAIIFPDGSIVNGSTRT